MLKRILDVILSAGALLALAPLFLVTALWVKLDSRQPAFFRQIRIGLRGREFRIYKFRTMRNDTDGSGPQITVGQDPRITRSGLFLRKYKIDELPQLINVLLGDMSIVGPRPEVPRYVALYPTAMRDLIFSVRPGITDLASIEFKDENTILGESQDAERTYVDEILPRKLRFYVYYVANRNLWLDLVIIYRTIRAVFGRR